MVTCVRVVFPTALPRSNKTPDPYAPPRARPPFPTLGKTAYPAARAKKLSRPGSVFLNISTMSLASLTDSSALSGRLVAQPTERASATIPGIINFIRFILLRIGVLPSAIVSALPTSGGTLYRGGMLAKQPASTPAQHCSEMLRKFPAEEVSANLHRLKEVISVAGKFARPR